MKSPWLHNGRLLVIAVAAVCLGALGWDVRWPDEPPTQVAVVQPVRGIPDYDRSAFGPAWADVDRNGCDTRNDILARDLEGETFKPGTRDCVVETGLLRDWYTGKVIEFRRGTVTSREVQVDHVVPLAWAWEHGAWEWDFERRLQFANDPDNLEAIDGRTNSSKQADGPAEWMPPHPAAVCPYATNWDLVLDLYGLVPNPEDGAALDRLMLECAL